MARLSTLEQRVGYLMSSLAQGDLPESHLIETISKGQVANANEINEIKMLLYTVGRDQNGILCMVEEIDKSMDRVIDRLDDIHLTVTKKTKKHVAKKRHTN